MPEISPKKTVTVPIISLRIKEQLNGSMRVLNLTLSQDAFIRLDGIIQDPGRTAPEAYGW